MTATVGSLVLAVAEAAGIARDGGIALVEYDGDAVTLSYSEALSDFVVGSAALFSDGHLARRVEALLRHA